MANWIKAQIIPKQWEGTRKLVYYRNDGNIDFTVVPQNFSREDRHCDGFYYADLPQPPTD